MDNSSAVSHNSEAFYIGDDCSGKNETISEKPKKAKLKAVKGKKKALDAAGSNAFESDEGAIYFNRGYLLFALVVMALTACVWLSVTETQMFPLKKIRFERQAENVSIEGVREIVLGQGVNSIFNVDVNEVNKQIEAMPWVDKAEVRVVWPDAISIKIEEQIAAATWNNEYLITKKGAVFAPENFEKVAVGLPALKGPQELNKRVAEQFFVISSMLDGEGIQVQKLSLDSRRSWQATLDNGITLVIGKNDVEERISRFIKGYKQALSGKLSQIESVDLRYTNGFAVAWNQEMANRNKDMSLDDSKGTF